MRRCVDHWWLDALMYQIKEVLNGRHCGALHGGPQINRRIEIYKHTFGRFNGTSGFPRIQVKSRADVPAKSNDLKIIEQAENRIVELDAAPIEFDAVSAECGINQTNVLQGWVLFTIQTAYKLRKWERIVAGLIITLCKSIVPIPKSMQWLCCQKSRIQITLEFLFFNFWNLQM